MALGQQNLLRYIQENVGERLVDSMVTSDSKCIWDVICLYKTIAFQNI